MSSASGATSSENINNQAHGANSPLRSPSSLSPSPSRMGGTGRGRGDNGNGGGDSGSKVRGEINQRDGPLENPLGRFNIVPVSHSGLISCVGQK